MNKWGILLEPEHISTGGEIGVEGTLDFILQELRNINGRFDNLEEGQAVLCERVGDIDSELKAFRIETRNSLQVIQTGQQGVREEMTQRFKETKNSLQTIQKDTELTYQKIALYDLKFNRLESMIDKK